MQNKIPEIPIHDIKPLLEIHEYSLYYFLALLVFGLIIFAVIIYFVEKYIKGRNAFNIRKEHLSLLEKIDYSDAKRSAYEITLYGTTFKNDSPRHSEMFANLTERLEAYKYKKSVAAFDDEVKGYVDLYRGMIDV
jgi:hypothetical protein